MKKQMERKAETLMEVLTDEHLIYLDNLRGSGVTNMFGASSYLVDEFGMSNREASEVLLYWMRTFSKRHKAV